MPHIIHYKHTYIYIYTKQQLRFPISFITNTHIFTFILYNNYDITISFITNTYFTFILYNNYDNPYPSLHKHIYIYTKQQLRYPYPSLHTHIFTLIVNNNYDIPYPSLQTHIYLHLYYKTTTISHILHCKHTYIYI